MKGFHAYGLSEQGPVRATNEDCFGLDDERGLCVVADGMGGHNGGEVASRIAVTGVTDYIRASDGDGAWPFGFDRSLSESANRLRTAVHVANGQILDAATSRRDLSGMGTTIVAALVEGDRLAIAHVGDSRLYVFDDGRLRLMTADDSWALNRNVLTNVLGARRDLDVHVAEERLTGATLIILVTDGVHTFVGDDLMAELARGGGAPAGIARKLVDLALSRGTRDNCTAVVAEYRGGL
jgi:serine/threonine protein phosphatase PrpC